MKKNLLKEEEDSEEEHVVIDLVTRRTEDSSEVDLTPEAESDFRRKDKSNLEINEKMGTKNKNSLLADFLIRFSKTPVKTSGRI